MPAAPLLPVMPEGLSPGAAATLQRWLTEPAFAPWVEQTRALLAAGTLAEIEEAFGTELAFGTGGMRGPCGPGPGRLNGWVVARAARGLAEWVLASTDADTPTGAAPGLSQHPAGSPRGVVVGFDARHGSRAFASITARVFGAAGLRVHLHAGLCSTPQLSFAVLAVGARAGVMLTASHNPPADNGFKAYTAAGHQFAPPQDADLVRLVQAAVPPPADTLPTEARLREAGLLVDVPADMTDRYVAAAVRSARLEGLPLGDVHVLFSPYHGVGAGSVLPALQLAGATVRVLEGQAAPDPDFPTLPGRIANPEEPATFARLLAAARDLDDILLAADPDADRIGAMVRTRPAGPWMWLDGHRLMVLAADFACRRWAHDEAVRRASGAAPKRAVVARSLVTSSMVDRVAEAACAAVGGAQVAGDQLVGLKYTGRLSARLAADPGREFVFGGEEAHGMLAGNHVRDKDAANAACLLAGSAAECQAVGGRTLWQHLLDLHRLHGIFAHAAASLSLSAAEGGTARAARIMAGLRARPPRTLAGRTVHSVVDHQGPVRRTTTIADGRTVEEPHDPGNVLVFVLASDGTDRITVRPSGTEPKLKLYGQLHGATTRADLRTMSDSQVESVLAEAGRELEALLAVVTAELRGK